MKINNVIYVALAGVLLFWYCSHTDALQKKKDLEDLEYQKQLQITEVPEATHKEWVGYLSANLEKKIRKVNRCSYEVTTSDAEEYDLDSKVYISGNMPYSLTCDEFFGISVEFGTDDHSVSLVNMLDEEELPNLPFLMESVAGKKLLKDLCQTAANKLSSHYYCEN